MFSKKKFSERIKALRINKSLKQSELANEIGVKNTTISMMESAQRSPSVEVMHALAKYFDVPLDYLLGLGIYAKAEEIEANHVVIAVSLQKLFEGTPLAQVFDPVSFCQLDVISRLRLIAAVVKDIEFTYDPLRIRIVKWRE